MPTYYDPAYMLDLREKQTNPPPMIGQDGKPKQRYATTVKNGKRVVVERDPKKITGITFHQTAVNFGVRDALLKKFGGDRLQAEASRLMGIPAHAVAGDQGKFVVHIPLTWYAYHGHGLNDFTLGLEMEANLPGVKGGKTWNGEPPTPVTPEFITVCRNATGYLYEEGRKLGMPIEYAYAHRQSTAKPSDPGQELWELVVIDFAVKELKLKVKYDFTLTDRNGRKGKPIPVEWDPNGVGHY